MRFTRQAAPLFALAAAACAPDGSSAQAPRSLADTAFAALSTRLSEPGGFFDTDNLISNEDSYLHAVSVLRKAAVTGGTYVGVGPDQNYSYIAAVRPRIAFIVDIRRDNLLQHLMLKAVFSLARNRAEYLSILFGRTPPADTAGWGARSVDSLLVRVERSPLDTAAPARVLARAAATGIRLSSSDSATIIRFHRAFIAGGPGLQFNTFGRAPQPQYPDFRRLATERDRDGRQASYLADEAAFAFVKGLHARNLIVPVVGDFAGPKALREITAWMRTHGERLSAFYTSNVEFYLYRAGTFTTFAASLERLPRDSGSVVIRSCFVCRFRTPHGVPGYAVIQLVQRVDQFAELRAAGQLHSYGNLVSLGNLVP